MGCGPILSPRWFPPVPKTSSSGLCSSVSQVESRGFMKLVLLCILFPPGLSQAFLTRTPAKAEGEGDLSQQKSPEGRALGLL